MREPNENKQEIKEVKKNLEENRDRNYHVEAEDEEEEIEEDFNEDNLDDLIKFTTKSSSSSHTARSTNKKNLRKFFEFFSNVSKNGGKHSKSSKHLDGDSLMLSENQVEYKIFILLDKSASLAYLDEIYMKMMDYINAMSSEYIWNNDKFTLSKPSTLMWPCQESSGISDSINACDNSISSSSNSCNNGSGSSSNMKASSNNQQRSSLMPCYYTCSGVLDYGDNMEDEWFAVYLLLNLTNKFSKILTAQIQDADGEFLLIHTANYLPAWASSAADDVMKNRVFLYEGKVHMIPPATNPAEITYLPASGPIAQTLDGVKIVNDFSKLTCASNSIQESIGKRLSIFDSIANTTTPSNSKLNLFHKATCTIPAKLAWVLNNNPSLISSAVNRFCDKDPNDLKLCRIFDCFKPLDMVNYRVKFTKHLYGKLKYCDYKPDRRHEWPSLDKIIANEATASTTAAATAFSSSSTAAKALSNQAERSIMGFKLTCAFEIMSRHALRDMTDAAKVTASTTTFEEYVDRLKNFGYFKGYLEESSKYNELMDEAKKSFETDLQHKQAASMVDSATSSTLSDMSADNSTANHNISNKQALYESFYSAEFKTNDYVKKVKDVINNKQIAEEDDSDDWLCVDAPQLDDYLDMYSRGDVGSSYDFRLITNAFKRFLQLPMSSASSSSNQNVLDGVDYKPIDKDDEHLVDFDLEKIENNLKDMLMNPSKSGQLSKKKEPRKKKMDLNIDNEDKFIHETDEDYDDDDDENDSFYEIGDDELDDDHSIRAEIEASTNSLKSYMNEMDKELNAKENLSRLDTNKPLSTSATATTHVTSASVSSDNTRPAENTSDLNIDINLVSNALESYSSQLGLSGPVTNIFKSLGL